MGSCPKLSLPVFSASLLRPCRLPSPSPRRPCPPLRRRRPMRPRAAAVHAVAWRRSLSWADQPPARSASLRPVPVQATGGKRGGEGGREKKQHTAGGTAGRAIANQPFAAALCYQIFLFVGRWRPRARRWAGVCSARGGSREERHGEGESASAGRIQIAFLL